VIRPRGGTARRRDDQDQPTSSSAAVIGGQLRDAREERGLDLLAVHDRLSRPITLLEALENGDLAALPDQAQALSTLRRYAAFLGLDGDALALQMLDAWSASPSSNGGARNGALTNVVTAVTTGPDHLRAFTQTGEVPKVGAGSSMGNGGSGAYGYGVRTGPPTGTFPVVPRQDIRHSKRAVARARRRLRAPTSLKVVTWVAALLVLAVALGFGIQHWRPQWLARSHILRVAGPHPGTVPPGSTTRTTGAPHQASVVVPTSASEQSSSYTVASRHFDVTLLTSGKCWVQVTSSSSITPLVVGVQPPGKSLSFPATGTMTVEVGASAVIVAVTVDGKPAFFNSPHSTPYTYQFVAASGS
jgi:hypothetical protein